MGHNGRPIPLAPQGTCKGVCQLLRLARLNQYSRCIRQHFRDAPYPRPNHWDPTGQCLQGGIRDAFHMTGHAGHIGSTIKWCQFTEGAGSDCKLQLRDPASQNPSPRSIDSQQTASIINLD